MMDGQQHPTQREPRQQRGARNFLTALNIGALLLVGFLLSLNHFLPFDQTSLPYNITVDQIPTVNMSTEQT